MTREAGNLPDKIQTRIFISQTITKNTEFFAVRADASALDIRLDGDKVICDNNP